MLNIAIVGTGNIAPSHVEGLLTFPERCKIVALCDIYPEKAQAMKEKYHLDCQVFDDHQKMLAAGVPIDVVHVCTPPYTHAEIAIHSMDAGKNVVVEKPMAVALDNDPDVKMFFKIPSRFKMETPIGTYNPDWAVYLNKNGDEKLYFVLETKGDTSFMHLKTSEQLKIHCGQEHFKALDSGIEMQTATDWSSLRKRV